MNFTKQDVLNALALTLRAPQGSLLQETKLGSLPNWDSMAQIEVISLLDTSFNTLLPIGSLDSALTVGDLLDIVEAGQHNIHNYSTRLEYA